MFDNVIMIDYTHAKSYQYKGKYCKTLFLGNCLMKKEEF